MMTFESLIVFLVIVALSYLLIFTGFGQYVKGLGSLFVKNVASTPEGANAFYEASIAEASSEYNKIYDLFNETYGESEQLKKDLTTAKAKLADAKSRCLTAANSGKMDAAKIFGQEAQELEVEIKDLEASVTEYAAAVKKLSELKEISEGEVNRLKAEQKQVVSGLVRDIKINIVHDKLNKVNRTTSDKALESVREMAQSKHNKAVGAEAAYESSISTKATRARKEMDSVALEDYIAKLQKNGK